MASLLFLGLCTCSCVYNSWALILMPRVISFKCRGLGAVGNALESDRQTVIDSFKLDIATILEEYITQNATQLDLSFLLENAHLITKGRLYEEVFIDRLDACTSADEMARVQQVDNMLKAFILSERKSRCRLKVNYLIAGASSKRLEQSIAMLSESDEVDEDLLRYVENLIRREQIRAVGPLAVLDGDAAPIIEGKTEKMVVDILSMILKRLQAELTTSSRPEIRLLANLLREENVEEREASLRLSLKKLEDLETFNLFLQDGINHLSATLRDRPVYTVNEPTIGGAAEMDTTLAKMLDIKQSLEIILNRLKTGMNDESDVFSTASDDYNA